MSRKKKIVPFSDTLPSLNMIKFYKLGVIQVLTPIWYRKGKHPWQWRVYNIYVVFAWIYNYIYVISYKIVITMLHPHSFILIFLFFRPSNTGLKINVLLKFQFTSNNADTIKKEADSILHQKLKLNESFLKIDTSLPYLKGKKYHFSFFVTVYHFNSLLIYREIFI